MLKNYKELNAWQKLCELCLNIYRITAKFTNEERYSLTSQIRSYGSVFELETQILLAGGLGFIEKGELNTAKKDIAEIERMLKALIKSL